MELVARSAGGTSRFCLQTIVSDLHEYGRRPNYSNTAALVDCRAEPVPVTGILSLPVFEGNRIVHPTAVHERSIIVAAHAVDLGCVLGG
jgi:hypothetical protein